MIRKEIDGVVMYNSREVDKVVCVDRVCVLGRELVSCMYLDEEFGEDVYVGEGVVLKMVVLGVSDGCLDFLRGLGLGCYIYVFKLNGWVVVSDTCCFL